MIYEYMQVEHLPAFVIIVIFFSMFFFFLFLDSPGLIGSICHSSCVDFVGSSRYKNWFPYKFVSILFFKRGWGGGEGRRSNFTGGFSVASSFLPGIHVEMSIRILYTMNLIICTTVRCGVAVHFPLVHIS